MSRRAVGSMLGRPHRDQMALNRRNQDTMVALAGGVEAAQERIAEPYKPHVPAYIWNEKSCRYHWRRDGTRDGKSFKKGTFHPVPNIPREQRLYRERLARRRDHRIHEKQGHRLKQKK